MPSRPSPVPSFEVYPCGRGLLLKAQVIHQLSDCKEHANERHFHGYILLSTVAELSVFKDRAVHGLARQRPPRYQELFLAISHCSFSRTGIEDRLSALNEQDPKRWKFQAMKSILPNGHPTVSETDQSSDKSNTWYPNGIPFHLQNTP